MTRTILLGAGASAEANVPTANDMVKRVHQLLRADHVTWKVIGPAFNAAVAGIHWYRANVKDDPLGAIDVEDLYRVLVDLADRRSNYLGPFVGVWSQAVALAEQSDLTVVTKRVARGLAEDANAWLHKVARAGASRAGTPSWPQFERALRSALEQSGRHESGRVFQQAADELISTLRQLCWIQDPNRVAYLGPLLESAKRSPLWIASLNYDNTIELAAKAATIECNVGISAAGVQGIEFPIEPIAAVTLAKLHGSINWTLDGEWNISIADSPCEEPALLFGTGDKLRIQGPYLDLIFAFRSRLEITTDLETCGYSFRDGHINHLLLRWLMGGAERRLHVFDPRLAANDVESNMRRTLEKKRTMTPGWFAQRLQVHNITAAEWAAGKT